MCLAGMSMTDDKATPEGHVKLHAAMDSDPIRAAINKETDALFETLRQKHEALDECTHLLQAILDGESVTWQTKDRIKSAVKNARRFL